MSKKCSLTGGILLVAGTAIGGGMLALPVLTSLAGFIPSIVVYLFCWLFMSATGLLFLEVSQCMRGEANIVSMAYFTLGKAGKCFAWIMYLFLFYCLTIAYMVGCGNIFSELTNFAIPDWLGPIVFTLLFVPFILIRTHLASILNGWLVGGLALSYLGFVLLGFFDVKWNYLLQRDWSYSTSVLPIAFTSFAYQGVIPTLATHMHHDLPLIRRSIVIGSFIPLLTYAIWEWLILGIVPLEGEHGLKAALDGGLNAVYPLQYFMNHSVTFWLGQSFAFFALVTSFIGVTLGLRDFLADGLEIKKTARGNLVLAAMVVIPPLCVAILYPHIFLIALGYAGGIGCALLLGLLPICMVWQGRYRLGLPFVPQLKGGRVVLTLLALFVLFELALELKKLLV